MSDADVALVPVEEMGITDEALAVRWQAIVDDGYMVLDTLIDREPHLALVETATGRLVCFVPMPSDHEEEALLRSLLDLWDEMKNRPKLLS